MIKYISLALMLCGLFSSVGAVTITPSHMEVIEVALEKSMTSQLPYGYNWTAKVPEFTKHSHIKVYSTEIKLPGNVDNGEIIAQVWLNTDRGPRLYAVPVEIQSKNNNSEIYTLSMK